MVYILAGDLSLANVFTKTTPSFDQANSIFLSLFIRRASINILKFLDVKSSLIYKSLMFFWNSFLAVNISFPFCWLANSKVPKAVRRSRRSVLKKPMTSSASESENNPAASQRRSVLKKPMTTSALPKKVQTKSVIVLISVDKLLSSSCSWDLLVETEMACCNLLYNSMFFPAFGLPNRLVVQCLQSSMSPWLKTPSSPLQSSHLYYSLVVSLL